MLQLEPIATNRSESTTSLNGKSALYKIYSEGDINNDMDNTDIYSNLNSDISKHPQDSVIASGKKTDSGLLYGIISFIVKLVILGALGNAYFLLLESIDVGKRIQLPSLEDFKILFIFTKIDFLHQFFDPKIVLIINNAIFGILLGTVDAFFFDNLFKSIINIPERSSYESTTILRSLIAIVGISYGLKKLEWESALQASLAWSLLNPCLWVLLDGTIYGFIFDSLFSVLFCFLSYQFDPQFFLVPDIQFEFWNKILWIGSAAFVGLLVFGKIGRFLFE